MFMQFVAVQEALCVDVLVKEWAFIKDLVEVAVTYHSLECLKERCVVADPH